MSDITKQSLTELVENIKNKKLSSADVTKAFIERSEKSKELNAYITEDFTSALDKAKKFDQKPNLDLKLEEPSIKLNQLIVKIQKMKELFVQVLVTMPKVSLFLVIG